MSYTKTIFFRLALAFMLVSQSVFAVSTSENQVGTPSAINTYQLVLDFKKLASDLIANDSTEEARQNLVAKAQKALHGLTDLEKVELLDALHKQLREARESVFENNNFSHGVAAVWAGVASAMLVTHFLNKENAKLNVGVIVAVLVATYAWILNSNSQKKDALLAKADEIETSLLNLRQSYERQLNALDL